MPALDEPIKSPSDVMIWQGCSGDVPLDNQRTVMGVPRSTTGALTLIDMVGTTKAGRY